MLFCRLGDCFCKGLHHRGVRYRLHQARRCVPGNGSFGLSQRVSNADCFGPTESCFESFSARLSFCVSTSAEYDRSLPPHIIVHRTSRLDGSYFTTQTTQKGLRFPTPSSMLSTTSSSERMQSATVPQVRCHSNWMNTQSFSDTSRQCVLVNSG